MKKPKTQEQLDRATDLRLQKTYNRDLAWYNAQLEEQEGGCGICERPEGTRRLHVDHDHSWKKIKIETMKTGGSWVAKALYLGNLYLESSEKKPTAVRKIKRLLLKNSVRGLLCYSCNAGLQKFSDSPTRFRAAAKYLEAHLGVRDETHDKD